LAALQNEFNNLNIQVNDGFQQLQGDIDTRAHRDELKDLESRFMDQMNDLVKVMTKKFADKAQNKKEHADMERQIRNLYDIIMAKGGNSTEQEAMFSTKPFAGLSCASCEKDLVNMYGKKVEYMPWGKMPFRDPSERIARVGQGFSKMLSMLKPDSLSRYEQSKAQSNFQNGGGNAGGIPPLNDQQQYNPNEMAQDIRKTHSRFPNSKSQMHVGEARRPGSSGAGADRHMARRPGRGK
jgi:hypothetical protein